MVAVDEEAGHGANAVHQNWHFRKPMIAMPLLESLLCLNNTA